MTIRSNIWRPGANLSEATQLKIIGRGENKVAHIYVYSARTFIVHEGYAVYASYGGDI